MTMTRISLLAGTAIAFVAPTPVMAAPGGMLVETHLADPDPGYIPPPAERKVASRRQAAKEPTLDETFENLGRVAGQAAQIMQQRAVDRLVQAHNASEPPKE